MTTVIADSVVAPLAADLVEALATEMALVPNPPATPRVVCLRPGDRVDLLISTNDDECCSGLSWVRMVSIVPSGDAFPGADATTSPCGVTRWAVMFEVGAVRCAPTPGGSDIPSCEEWTDVTLACYDDGAAIRRAICRYATEHPYDLVLQGEGRPLTTEGGCVGISYLVTMSAAACECGGTP